MHIRILCAAFAVPILGSCSASFDPTGSTGDGAVGDLPEVVAAIAAPYQDLQSARLRPEDGCYWYLHAGPVETTLIPLRTLEGRPICTRPQS